MLLSQTAVAGIFAPVSRAAASCCRPLEFLFLFLFHARVMFLATLLLLLLAHTPATSAASSSALVAPSSEPHECSSIDVRNECQRLLQLQGCTVIKGYLIIVLLPKVSNNTRDTCDYQQYKFPLLREITDYLIFYDVKGLVSIRDLFPNLNVIRGRRLFLNYALGISTMPDLKTLEFKNLVAIQRGHVYIGSCPKLCNLGNINWDRLTLARGENHVYPMAEGCPAHDECKGCESGYCWSSMICQKFENDNVVHLLQGSQYCHPECLGGCYNATSRGCVVCRRLTDGGECVAECPENKYLLEHHQRCYTRQECTDRLGLYTYEASCVAECPSGFLPGEDNSTCVACRAGQECTKVCQVPALNGAITVFNLEDADLLRGCEVLNGSLVIAIRNAVNEDDLAASLGSVREIRGHLKVYRSPHLTSLRFLQNLTRIAGDPLENDLYALIVYDNKNLRRLWNVGQLELQQGSMFVHLNNKLCNSHIRAFRDRVVHDRSKDSVQTSDQEVLCDPAKLMLEVQVLSHSSVLVQWPKEQTSEEVEVIYRPSASGAANLEEDSELDSHVCTRINWERRLLFRSELRENGTRYGFVVTGLQPNTQYACLVKTFGADEQRNARSPLLLVRTRPDRPTPPLLAVVRRTESSLTLRLEPQNRGHEQVDHYRLDVFEQAENQTLLDRRNYCEDPALPYQDAPLDYDDCCARLEEAAEDRQFRRLLGDAFACSLDAPENCDDADAEPKLPDSQRPLRSLKLASSETTFTLHHLERFRLYSLQVRACSEAVGCGAYSLQSERTNFSTAGDRLEDLTACRVATPGLGVEHHVHFAEPVHPNGLIVSYVIHFRIYVPDSDAFQSHLVCVTRRQHAEANYRHVARLNSSFQEVAVRVHSLAGDVLSQWVEVTECPPTTPTNLAGVGVADGGATEASHGHGVNVFLVFFLLGAGGTVLWVCYKRRYCRKLPEMRRYLPLQRGWRAALAAETCVEDRQILVDGFETVRFHNNPDDDQRYLESIDR